MKHPERNHFLALSLGLVLLLSGCERPPPDVKQQGFRGTGMVAVQNPRLVAALQPSNRIPESPPPIDAADAPLAKDVYQNVQVLTDLNVAEFARHMVAQANWIAPDQQCTYCHEPENYASDAKYTKIVARRMIAMTRDINMNWQSHVKETGVTCFTCHRGNGVPRFTWFVDPGPRTPGGMAGNRAGQNYPAPAVRLASLPLDPFTPFLLGGGTIRVESTTALPAGNPATVMGTEQTYALMMHITAGLGVNCTHCHNTQHFSTWEGQPPARVSAWYGIRLVRALNNDYLVPLTDQFPPHRLGPTGDVAKVNCATCHQGIAKPLNGVSMLPQHPELARIKPPPPPPPPVDAAAEVATAASGPGTGAT
jgi:photosynthetic reaction center cytochrome c subunit